MSYVVRHRVEWDRAKVSQDKINRKVAELIGTSPDHAEDILIGSIREDWENRSNDFEFISSELRGVVFMIDCEGEDGAKWVEYFKDGKSYSHDYGAPAFDESLLR